MGNRLSQILRLEDKSGEEKLLLLSMIALVLAAGSMVFNKFFNKHNTQNSRYTKVLGEIYPEGGDVKKKAYRSFDFSAIDTEQNIFQKDTVYVGPGSKATLDLKEYGTLKLSPNAVVLLTIDFDEETPAADASPARPDMPIVVAGENKKNLHLKLEEGRAEFANTAEKEIAPSSDKKAPKSKKGSVILEVGDRLKIDLSNQKQLVAENNKEQVARVVSAEKPDEIKATLKTASGEEKPVDVSTSDIFQFKATPKKNDLEEKPESSKVAESSIVDQILEREPAAEKSVEPILVAKPEPAKEIKKTNELEVQLEDQVAPVAVKKEEPTKIAESKADAPSAIVRLSHFDIAPRAYYTHITGTEPTNGTKAQIVSKLNFGFDFNWEQRWSDRFRTVSLFGIRRELYYPDPNRPTSFTGNKQTLLSSGMGVRYLPRPSFTLGFDAQFSQELFYRGNPNGLGIIMENIWLPKFQLSLDYLAITRDPYWLSLGAKGFAYPFSATTNNYDTKAGAGINAYLKVGKKFHSNFESYLGLYYQQSSLSSSIVNLQRSELGFMLGLSLALDRRQTEIKRDKEAGGVSK